MTDEDKADPVSKNEEPQLYPDDQKAVDEFLKTGVNSVERKPFRPIYLMLILIAFVTGLSLFSQWLANMAGVY
ncbi:MAG: DUF3094 family protein [Pseudomonadota bacterium]